MSSIEIKTSSETELIDVTDNVRRIVREKKTMDGICIVFTKHTTSAIIINENEHGLIEDIVVSLQKLFPKGSGYSHDKVDSNAHSHLRAIFLGSSQAIPIERGELGLGTWQRIFFVELDGPRRRQVEVKVLGD